MKKLYIVIVALLLTVITFAQAPDKMSYQAVIRNSGNALVTNQVVGMRISILQTTATGTALYVETQTPTTNANGLVSLEIGTGTVFSGTFAGINWSAGPYFIKTETDPTGAETNYTLTSTSQLMSVPYALYAKTSGNGFTNGSSAGEMLYWNGSSWVAIPSGTVGQVLTLGNTGPVWQTPSGTSNGTITLTTTAASNIQSLTATCGGDISGSATPVTARGVCYSTSPNPTIANSLTTNGTGIGTFSSNLTGLTGNTTYYVRAYATNSMGTAYGNEVNFTTTQEWSGPAIGQPYLGGILAYVLQPGDPGYDANVTHGIIAAPSDQSNGISWYNGSYFTTGATGSELGIGQVNTTLIVSSQGSGSYAAQLCNDLVLGGYSDWYLPSKDELNKLYLNRVAIGGFAVNFYWCSTETGVNVALRQFFGNGTQFAISKSDVFYVRSVRSF